MGTKLLTERMALSGTVGGTAEAPVVEAVLLCGATSANRRRYKAEAFAGDRVKRYNGVPVKVTVKHGDANGLYQEQIGVVTNARLRADGMPIGDLAINPHKPYAAAFLWDAKNQPKACGMSHVANCATTKAPDGWDDVNELVEAVSVDVIGANGAATTKGLFEGKTVPQISLKTFVERFGPKWGPAKWGAAKKVVEEFGAPAEMPVMDEPPADATDGDLKSALMSAITPMLDDAFETGDATKLIAALKDFIKLHAKHTGKAPDKAEPPEEPVGEGKRPTLTGLIAECKAGGLTAPTTDHLAALSEISSPTGRAATIAIFKGNTTETRPSGTSRRPGAGGAGTAGNTTTVEQKGPPKVPAMPKWAEI